MNKHVTIIIALLIGIITGCQGKNPSNTGVYQDPVNMIAPVSSPTATSQASAAEAAPAGCTVISPNPTPGPTEESMFTPVTDDDWSIGLEDATVTILEYGDYQCEGCAGLAPVLLQIQEEYAEDVRLVYRHFPLIGMHDKAAITTQAAEAAGLQGKFWEMHSFLFAQQKEWIDFTAEEFKEWVISHAESLGLDKAQFEEDMLSDELAAMTQNAWDKGYQTGIPGTPFILLNNEIFSNNFPLTEGNLRAILNLHLLEKRQFTTCPPMTIDINKRYTASIHTEKGDIILQLFPKQAPIAVNNFIFLARNGWYDNIIFHRVITGFGAQAGDPSGTGYGSPGYAFINEISSDLTFDKPGVLAMANAGPGTNGSQFFITFAAAPHLDGKYTIFGEVIDGLDVAENLTPRDTQENLSQYGDKIISVTIDEQ
ncbi:MAG: peptidylprolyl isomerase [Anaerolineales bacterium]|nr:peptidylprolyl isomerase [Anaerolineales bacterium]